MANIEDFYESKKGSPLPDELRVTQSEPEKMPEPEKSGGSKALLFFVILFAIAALGLAGFFYWKYTNTQKNIEAQKIACQESIKQEQEIIASMKVQEDEDTEKEKQKATEEIVKVRVVVYNGTNITGLAKSLGEKAAEISGVEISTTTNAKNNYTKNIVVNLGKVDSEIAQKIADKIDGEIGDMPDGETKPEADILVIGGKSVK